MGHPDHAATLSREATADPSGLNLSQISNSQRSGITNYTDISKYELDKNEPPLVVLLAYSRASGIPLEQSLTMLLICSVNNFFQNSLTLLRSCRLP